MADKPKTKEMPREVQRRMRTLIHQKAAAATRDYELGVKLNDLTEEYYGVAASDVDADNIIDALFGGAGGGSSMTLDEYLDTMNKAQSKVTVTLAKRNPIPVKDNPKVVVSKPKAKKIITKDP